MRLLILTQYFPPEVGAAQSRLSALARELLQRGHDVEVVTAMPNHLSDRVYAEYRGKVYARESADGMVVHRTWVFAATGTGVRRMLNYCSFALSSIIGLMRAGRPDLVFVESPPLFLGVPGWLAAKFHRCALLFNVADVWPDAARDLGVLRNSKLLGVAEHLEAWTYRRASIINAVTTGIDQTLRESKRVPREKLRYLPNGIDVETFRPRERNAELADRLGIDERPLFLYAGTHGIAYALEDVVAAAALVPEAQVLFVGSGTTKPGVVAYAKGRGVKNVRFLEPVAPHRLPDYFSLACASLIPLVKSAVNEGARPAKLFASLACGVPVIYGGDGEGAAIVRDGGAGIVIPAQAVSALAEAMRTLMRNRVEHAAMSQRARTLAVVRYAWPGIVDRWLASL